jgi:hypothetical protein
MGCCDKKRSVMAPTSRSGSQVNRAVTQESRPGTRVGRGAESARRPAAAVPPARVTVRYAGAQRIRVRGTVTGSIYHCSASSLMLSVDVRDVAALLRTGLFTA